MTGKIYLQMKVTLPDVMSRGYNLDTRPILSPLVEKRHFVQEMNRSLYHPRRSKKKGVDDEESEETTKE